MRNTTTLSNTFTHHLAEGLITYYCTSTVHPPTQQRLAPYATVASPTVSDTTRPLPMPPDQHFLANYINHNHIIHIRPHTHTRAAHTTATRFASSMAIVDAAHSATRLEHTDRRHLSVPPGS